MKWISYNTPRNTEYKHCVILAESNWRTVGDIAISEHFDKIRGWLIGQHLSPGSKECLLSVPNGIIMFKDEGAQSMFLLHWSGDAQA